MTTRLAAPGRRGVAINSVIFNCARFIGSANRSRLSLYDVPDQARFDPNCHHCYAARDRDVGRISDGRGKRPVLRAPAWFGGVPRRNSINPEGKFPDLHEVS